MRYSLPLLLALLTLALATMAQSQPPQPTLPPLALPGAAMPVQAKCAPPGRKAMAATVLDLLNAERAAAGLKPFRAAPKLAAAAQAHACDNARTRSLSHVSPDGADLGTRLKRVGYAFATVAKNNALGYNNDPAQVVRGWMASPPHRANILNPGLRQIGLGIGKARAQAWVLVLATPL